MYFIGFNVPKNGSMEDQVEYHDGDFNIEYVLIYNEKGEILWKDQDYEG